MKQLDQRYQGVCDNIKDSQEYTMQHLWPNIQVDVPDFCSTLYSANLEQLEANIDVMEEVLSQCRIAIKNEQSRRLLQEQIIKFTEKQTQKDARKQRFQLKRRAARLVEATPYPMTRQPSVSQ